MRLPPSVVSLAPAPSTLAGSLTTNSTRLLVSVRDSREAQLARRSGVPWIDLKDPDNGSLGAAGEAIAAAVAGELRASDMLPESLISAAVGELRDEPLQTALRLAQYFPLLKVGLAGVQADAQWQRRWLELAKQIDGAGAELVPVIYADHALCGAPSPIEVLSLAQRTQVGRLGYLLIDTYTKDGRRLHDWMGRAQIEQTIQAAAEVGRRVVLAGSLTAQDLPGLLSLPIAAVAVRGAVCSGDRRSGLCPEKLRQWVDYLQIR